MTNYVLVHGGDRDGSLWDDTASFLKPHGHQVFCPTMKSVTQAALSENIDQITQLIQDHQLQDIVLVGHSYGAMVITGVADKISDKIKILVFVDSVIPKNGTSLYGLLAEKGLNYQDFGLTPDRACLDKISFNEKNFSSKNKAYILSLQSEFFTITKSAYDAASSKASTENWTTFCLDTTHACMLKQPKQLATLLVGIGSIL